MSDPANKNLKINFNRLFKILLIVLPLALAGNIIYTLLTSKLQILSELLHFKIGYLILAVSLCLIPWLAQSIRIKIWSRIFGIPVTNTQAFRAVLSCDIAAAATPTMLGGGYAKAGYLISYGYSAGEATIVTLLGTIEDAVFFLIAIPTTIVWSRAWENLYVRQAVDNLISHWPFVLIVIVLLAIVLWVMNRFVDLKTSEKQIHIPRDMTFRHKFGLFLRRYKTDLGNALKFAFTKGRFAFIFTIFFAGIGWSARYCGITALVYGLGLDADPVLFFVLQWVVFTTMTMIPTPGAIGGAEVSFALIYGGLIPSFAIPVVTSGWRFITFYLPLGLGSLIFALIGGANIKKRNNPISIGRENTKTAVCSEDTGK